MGGSTFYVGPTFSAASGVQYSNVPGLRIPLSVGANFSVIGTRESEEPEELEDADEPFDFSVLAAAEPEVEEPEDAGGAVHGDWGVQYIRLFDIENGRSSDGNRLAFNTTISFNIGKLTFGFLSGLYGEWGNTNNDDYWGIGFLGGPRFDVMPFSPDIPLSIYIEAIANIGGGQEGESGTFHGGILGAAGLQLAFY